MFPRCNKIHLLPSDQCLNTLFLCNSFALSQGLEEKNICYWKKTKSSARSSRILLRWQKTRFKKTSLCQLDILPKRCKVTHQDIKQSKISNRSRGTFYEKIPSCPGGALNLTGWAPPDCGGVKHSFVIKQIIHFLFFLKCWL